jgi:hypothetical protein
MTSATESDLMVRYEGGGTGTELWGSTQANFLVGVARQHAREIGVLVNVAGTAYLAGLAGRDDTPEFRAEVARVVGSLWIRHLVEERRRIDAVIMLSRAVLESEPEFVAGAAAALRG